MRWTYEQLRRRGGIVVTIGLALVVLVAAGGIVAWRVFGPERFEDLELGTTDGATDLPHDPQAPLALASTTRVYLVYSVGSKGLSRSEADRLRINDLASRGADGLTDTMMLLFVDPPTRQAALLSIPRDTWLFDRGHRINGSYNLHGLQAFIDDMSRLVGVPIHHVVEVNFSGFAQLVDDVGGVPLRVGKALADVPSVLYVPGPGCWRFDGASALAYVRSRHTLTQRSGQWVVDNSASDWGRMARQRQLLAAAWEQLRGPGLITKLPSLLSAAKQGLRLDDELGVRELADLARTFADIGPWGIESYTLPTTGRRISGAAAQVVVEDAARPILRRLRSWPPGRDAAPEPSPTADAASPEPTASAPAPSPTAQPTPEPTAEATVETLDPPDAACTLATAAELPDPAGPLAEVYRSRGGDTGVEGDPDDDPSASPSPDPSASPTPSSSEEPSEEPTPDDEPTPGPTPTLTLPPLPG